MNRISTKKTAEAVLRELPSVLGAYVSEDLEGYPREIHLLVKSGPDAAHLARDIRSLLEERLGIPIDQRVISIAQLAAPAASTGGVLDREQAVPHAGVSAGATSEDESPAGQPTGREGDSSRADQEDPQPASRRPVFAGIESTTSAGHVKVKVRLEWQGGGAEGEAEAVDTQAGRARAAAIATLRSAVDAPWNEGLDLELDFASLVQALDGEYTLVSVLAMSRRLGRRPLSLVGAHPVESDVESAGALATLKAINRVLSLAIRES